MVSARPDINHRNTRYRLNEFSVGTFAVFWLYVNPTKNLEWILHIAR